MTLAVDSRSPCTWFESGRTRGLLQEKGLGDKHRVYEVLGSNHVFTAGALDLGGLMEAMIDILDEWVEEATAPPASRARGVAGISSPPIALPEVACPLGIHYAYPDDAPNEGRASQTTNFAPFDGTGLEPLDWRGELVDMNENGVRDERESVDAAWRRLGLLGAQEPFTAEQYAACVEEAAVGLAEERLLPWRVVEHYRSEAPDLALTSDPGSGLALSDKQEGHLIYDNGVQVISGTGPDPTIPPVSQMALPGRRAHGQPPQVVNVGGASWEIQSIGLHGQISGSSALPDGHVTVIAPDRATFDRVVSALQRRS